MINDYECKHYENVVKVEFLPNISTLTNCKVFRMNLLYRNYFDISIIIKR